MTEQGTGEVVQRSEGYGFIRRETGEDVFVHHASIAGEGRTILF